MTQPMKVLVTGGAGFLGSHIADALSDRGHQVLLFDRIPSPYLRSDQKMVVGDIKDRALVNDVVAGCGAIYHLAAIADLAEATSDPHRAVEINIMGTVNMLEAARKHKVGRFIFSSSIYVYSAQGAIYRTTKQACENLISDYQDNYGLEFTILRFGSLYGPRTDGNNAIHRVLRQALTDRRIDFWGNGSEIREYIHVLDAARMSLDILASEYANQIIHLTGRERMTTQEMLEMIREILGGDIEIAFNDTPFTGRYIQTPYAYAPRLGRRMTGSTYIDLGLGLLDQIQSIEQDRSTLKS